ncbi:hypothetical protein [Rhizobium sp. 2MFCol3.1]|uniref:hypothetical protein n=1 Tax=Rhizobium sp. 2MFCol3.1 TaxID=1246459 RepID=UPI00037356A0|nr:hypothetical protein [Rhizobium sp. 2MFCol3.1]
MPSRITAEIRHAQNGLQWMNYEERVELVSRILTELRDIRKDVLGRIRVDKRIWLDTLIARVSSELIQIAAMGDMEFKLVLIEFEKLLGVFDIPNPDPHQLSPTIQ